MNPLPFPFSQTCGRFDEFPARAFYRQGGNVTFWLQVPEAVKAEHSDFPGMPGLWRIDLDFDRNHGGPRLWGRTQHEVWGKVEECLVSQGWTKLEL